MDLSTPSSSSSSSSSSTTTTMDLSTPSSSTTTTTTTTTTPPLTAPRKRVKLSPLLPKGPLHLHHHHHNQHPNTKWRSPAQERLYRHRLLDALRSTTNSSNPRDPRAIKDAADSALALTARGQSRWSRAILSRRWRIKKVALRATGKLRRRRRPPPLPSSNEKKQQQMIARPPDGKVGERLRRLARLVPGCRRAPTGPLLEETADYVAALEVQVRAMRALADALAATAISPSQGEEAEEEEENGRS